MLGVARRPICCAASIWPGNESDEAARAGDTARCVQLWGRRFRLPTDCFTVPSEIIHAETSCPFLAALVAAIPLWGASYYTVRLDDPKAVYLTRDDFAVHGDGLADDTDALQQAINKVQETTNQGIVFVPEGRYRLSKTIYIWPGIRVIGYGATRPVLVLAENTPGYQDNEHEKLMVFFAGWRPGAGRGPASPAVRQARSRAAVAPPATKLRMPGRVPSIRP